MRQRYRQMSAIFEALLSSLLRVTPPTALIVGEWTFFLATRQFLAPGDVKNIGDKLAAFGCERFMFTERGTTFGYNNLVADMRSLYWIREAGYRIVFDATHSVQRPGGAGDKTGGDCILAPILARAAAAAGCDGIFIETHEDPTQALSDGPNQIPLSQLPALLKQLLQIHALVS